LTQSLNLTLSSETGEETIAAVWDGLRNDSLLTGDDRFAHIPFASGADDFAVESIAFDRDAAGFANEMV
jgi:hypothetical protein